MSEVAVSFAAGVLAGFGPCAAGRASLIATFRGDTARSAMLVVAFAAGTIVAFVLVTLIPGATALLARFAPVVDRLAALALIVAGIIALVRLEHRCVPARPSGAFLLGVAGATVASPCCGPVALALAAMAAADGDAAHASAVAAAFACGHVLPLAILVIGGARLAPLVTRVVQAPVLATIAGGTSIGLGALLLVSA